MWTNLIYELIQRRHQKSEKVHLQSYSRKSYGRYEIYKSLETSQEGQKHNSCGPKNFTLIITYYLPLK